MKKTLREFMSEKLNVEAYDGPFLSDVARSISSRYRSSGRYEISRKFAILSLEIGRQEIPDRLNDEREHFVLWPVDSLPNERLANAAHVFYWTQGYCFHGSLTLNEDESTYVFKRNNEYFRVVSLTRARVGESSALLVTAEPVHVQNKRTGKSNLASRLKNFFRDESCIDTERCFRDIARAGKRGAEIYVEEMTNPLEKRQNFKLALYAALSYAAFSLGGGCESFFN